MMRFRTAGGILCVFVLGAAAGFALSSRPALIRAADEDQNPLYSRDVLEAYRKSNKAIRELNNLFVGGGQSTSAFTGLNYFGASVGGIDAERDLEEGRGVDPETFAALYAGLASPRIIEHLDQDELGRLRYKKNVIRIYSQERLRQLFNRRDQLEIRSESAN